MKAVAAAVTRNTSNLTTDGNLGLAKQVVAARSRKHISQLTQAYVTLSLEVSYTFYGYTFYNYNAFS